MGRFLGMAWYTGDMFTFKVWSEPDGDWRTIYFIFELVNIPEAEEMDDNFKATMDSNEEYVVLQPTLKKHP